MDGEDPDRNACDRGGEPTERTRLRAVRMHDVRLRLRQTHELDQAEQVTPGADRPPDVLELDERNA